MGEALHGGAACALPTSLAAMGRGGEAGLVGGVSSFGYGGTIAHVLLENKPSGGAAAEAVGGRAALRFLRHAFPWATAAENAHDGSVIALYSVAWVELAAPATAPPDGQWLAVQPAGASGIAAREIGRAHV